VSPDPSIWWRALASGLAGQPRVRVARRTPDGRGGFRLDYDRERPLTAQLPAEPAAVRLYDDAGVARTLALDLDPRPLPDQVETSTERTARVTADAAALTGLLVECGARIVEDSSPRGGRHVWAPLATPASRAELEPILRVLAARFATLDVGPALNVAVGCLRPPGAVHLSGGHQRLETPLQAAVEAVERRSAPDLLDRLRARLGVATDPLQTAPAVGERLVDPDAVVRPGGPSPLSPAQVAIATTGGWPAERYESASEARQAVLAGAAARGWCLRDVQAAIADGTWSGLWSMYRVRWAEPTAARQLARDWRKALVYAETPFGAQTAVQTDGGPVPNDPWNRTSAPTATAPPSVSPSPTQGGPPQHRGGPDNRLSGNTGTGSSRAHTRTEHRYLRRWFATWTDVAPTRFTGKEGYAERAVLWALGWAAQVRGSRCIEVGTRTLALAGALLDHSTVAAVLREWRDRTDAPIVLIRTGAGDRGDLYELTIPDELAHHWDGRPLPTGRIGRVDPVWAQIGLPEWCLYEAIARGATGSAPELAAVAAVSRGEAYKALAVLADHGLVTKIGTSWRRTRRTLTGLARRLGTAALVAARAAAYAVERSAWQILIAAGRRIRPVRNALNGRSAALSGPNEPILWPDHLDEPPDDPYAAPPSRLAAAARWTDDAVDQVVAAAEQLLIDVLGAIPLRS
jgi:hypothetical protein